MFNFMFVIFCDCNFGWMGIGYLSTALKKLDFVKVTAKYYNLNEVEKACEEISALVPDAIGLPVMYNNLKETKKFVSKAKNLMPRTHFVLGNKEVTAKPETIMHWCPGVDSVVIGEGEHTIRELVYRLEKGLSLKYCEGIFYREQNRIVKNEYRSYEKNIETLGYPDRNVLPIINTPVFRSPTRKVFPIISSRGCRGRCTFCDFDRGNRYAVRARSMEKIFDEIEMLINQYGANYIIFGDDSFEDSAPAPEIRFSQLAQTIKSRNVNFRFFISCRLDTLKMPVFKTLQELKSIGLDRIFIGLDAANESDLRLYNKRAKMEDNIEGLQLLSKLKISFATGFIMFNPYSSFERLRENIKFLNRFKLCALDIISSRLALFSGALLTKKAIKDGLMEKKYPIVDPYRYQFQDHRIEQAWSAVSKIQIPSTFGDKVLNPTNYNDEILNAYSLYYWLSDLQSNNGLRKDTKEFGELLSDYTHNGNHDSCVLFNKVIDLAEESKTDSYIVDILQKDYQALTRRLEKMYECIKAKKLAIEDRLSDKGGLPIGF